MDKSDLRRWKVRDTLFSPWRELPGRYTAAEICGRRANSEFKVAVPIEECEHGTPSNVARFHIVAVDERAI